MSLVKENNVFSGHHLLQIKISDQQGFYSIQNLSVAVCKCSITPNCHLKMDSEVRKGSVCAWMLGLAILILTGDLQCFDDTVLIYNEWFCKKKWKHCVKVQTLWVALDSWTPLTYSEKSRETAVHKELMTNPNTQHKPKYEGSLKRAKAKVMGLMSSSTECIHHNNNASNDRNGGPGSMTWRGTKTGPKQHKVWPHRWERCWMQALHHTSHLGLSVGTQNSRLVACADYKIWKKC